MMKVLALFVVIAIVVCKGEAETDGKWKLKNGSPRTINIIETTMKDPALEQEIINGLILGMASSKEKHEIAKIVIDHIKKLASCVCLIIPSDKLPDKFGFASTTTEYVRIEDTKNSDVEIYVFKV